MISYWEKVLGCLIGVPIGDALGLPVETWPYEKIQHFFGELNQFVMPTDNNDWYGENGKYAGWFQLGQTSDDTQLTLAVMEAITEAGRIDLNLIAKKYCEQMQKCSIGWGKSTKQSVRKMQEGVQLIECGNPGGAGNGVVMKLAPVVIWLWLSPRYQDRVRFWNHLSDEDEQMLVDFTIMTHKSDMAVAATFGHLAALGYCLDTECRNFYLPYFRQQVVNGARRGYILAQKRDLPVAQGNLLDNLDALAERPWLASDDMATVRKLFGEGQCSLLHSLPFSYSYFLSSHCGVGALYDVASAGGDADTNASIVGSMLGALQGAKIFPERLKNFAGVDEYLAAVDRFFEKI